MAVRLKIKQVQEIAPQIEQAILDGRSKEQICKDFDIFMGAVNAYLRYFANSHVRELALSNGKNISKVDKNR